MVACHTTKYSPRWGLNATLERFNASVLLTSVGTLQMGKFDPAREPAFSGPVESDRSSSRAATRWVIFSNHSATGDVGSTTSSAGLTRRPTGSRALAGASGGVSGSSSRTDHVGPGSNPAAPWPVSPAASREAPPPATCVSGTARTGGCGSWSTAAPTRWGLPASEGMESAPGTASDTAAASDRHSPTATRATGCSL